MTWGASIVQWLEYAVANGVARVQFPVDARLYTFLDAVPWVSGLVAWFSLRVREVGSSILPWPHLLYCLTFFSCCLLLCDSVHLLLICWVSVGFEYVWLIVFTIMMKWLWFYGRAQCSILFCLFVYWSCCPLCLCHRPMTAVTVLVMTKIVIIQTCSK